MKPFATLLLLFLGLTTFGPGSVLGDLTRNVNYCPKDHDKSSKNLISNELNCLKKENTFDEIVKHIGKFTDGSDYVVCRGKDNHLSDDNEDYRVERQPRGSVQCRREEEKEGEHRGYKCMHKDQKSIEEDPRGPCEVCICPRNILTDGTSHLKKAILIGIHGALRSCPDWDPNYLECLCLTGIEDNHLNRFAKFFKRPQAGYEKKRCPRGRTIIGALWPSWWEWEWEWEKRGVVPRGELTIIGEQVRDLCMLRCCLRRPLIDARDSYRSPLTSF